MLEINLFITDDISWGYKQRVNGYKQGFQIDPYLSFKTSVAYFYNNLAQYCELDYVNNRLSTLYNPHWDKLHGLQLGYNSTNRITCIQMVRYDLLWGFYIEFSEDDDIFTDYDPYSGPVRYMTYR